MTVSITKEQATPFEAFVELAGRFGWDTEQEFAGGLFRDKRLQAAWDALAHRAALASGQSEQAAVEAPEGWRLAKVDPTVEMTRAATMWLRNLHLMRATDRTNAINDAYRAMLSVSPVPAPAAPAGGSGVPEFLDALRDALSVASSVCISLDRRVVRDGCVMYLQTEEWCRWAEQEVAPKLRSAIAAIAASAASAAPAAPAAPAGQAKPDAWRVEKSGDWIYFEQYPQWHAENGFVVQSLYTAPPGAVPDAQKEEGDDGSNGGGVKGGSDGR